MGNVAQGSTVRTTPSAVGNADTSEPGRDPLLSIVCHDLRAPLASVTMGANFVLQTLDDSEDNARQRRILEAMVRSCAQMERLVKNFADLSEIENATLVLKRADADAHELLEVTRSTVMAGARSAARPEIVVTTPSVRTALRCDRERLARALLHLAERAERVAPRGTVVTLTVEASERAVSFGIHDRGKVLSEDARVHLFDRRWHAEHDRTSGAGLGLAIAHGFARAHGGDIAVTSTEADGTTLALHVPR